MRLCERGPLTYECAAKRVFTCFTCSAQGQLREEWLFVRRESDESMSFSLCNAPASTALSKMAAWRCQHYFVERTFQDGKSELGWDELVARKYSAWLHHTALSALALWFIMQTKLDWAKTHTPDPHLASELGLEALPALSISNARQMLCAAMSLPRLSFEQSRNLVAMHLVNRSRSTLSRIKKKTKKSRKI